MNREVGKEKNDMMRKCGETVENVWIFWKIVWVEGEEENLECEGEVDQSWPFMSFVVLVLATH